MADEIDCTIGFFGIASILLSAASLFIGGLGSVFVGFAGVASGFFGAKKKQIFSTTAMMVGAVSLIFFNLTSMGIIKVPASQATGKEHLANSIYASIGAFGLLREGGSDDNGDIIRYFEKGLNQAKLVNIDQIDSQVPGFAVHYKNEFIAGMKSLLEGYENSDSAKKLQGGALLDEWAKWNKENNQKLDKIKEPTVSTFSFVKTFFD